MKKLFHKLIAILLISTKILAQRRLPMRIIEGVFPKLSKEDQEAIIKRNKIRARLAEECHKRAADSKLTFPANLRQ